MDKTWARANSKGMGRAKATSRAEGVGIEGTSRVVDTTTEADTVVSSGASAVGDGSNGVTAMGDGSSGVGFSFAGSVS